MRKANNLSQAIKAQPYTKNNKQQTIQNNHKSKSKQTKNQIQTITTHKAIAAQYTKPTNKNPLQNTQKQPTNQTANPHQTKHRITTKNC